MSPIFIEQCRERTLGEIFGDDTPVSIYDNSLAWLSLPQRDFVDYAAGRKRYSFDAVPEDPKVFRNQPTFLITQAHRIWLTIRKIGQYLTTDPGAVVLDLGSFPFTVDLAIRDYLRLDCRMIVTVNQNMQADWQAALTENRIEWIPVNLDPRVKPGPGEPAAAEGLPLEDESVDFIVFSHVIEHLYHPIQILKEACRVLKKGGKLLLSTDNGYMLGGFLNYLHPQSYLHEPVEQTAAMTFHEWRGHVRFFTETDLRTLIEAAGAHVVECELWEVLYNNLWEEYFVEPQLQIPRWRANLLTEYPVYRNEIILVAEK